MQNIEIKLTLSNPRGTIDFLQQEDDISFEWQKEQIDTYFKVGKGRLKIRQQDGDQAHLIEYYRPDEASERISNYHLTNLENPQESIADFSQKFGVLAAVEKKRSLYLFRNVRIHLDEVKQLGDFLEFESVISEQFPPETAQENLTYIRQKLKPFLGIPQSLGYLDLLLQQGI